MGSSKTGRGCNLPPASHPNSLTPCLLQTSFSSPIHLLLLLHRHHHLHPPSFSHRQRPSQFSQSTAFNRSRTPLILSSTLLSNRTAFATCCALLSGRSACLSRAEHVRLNPLVNDVDTNSRRNNFDNTYNSNSLKFACVASQLESFRVFSLKPPVHNRHYLSSVFPHRNTNVQ